MLQRNEKNQRPFRGIQATMMNFFMTRVFFWSMMGRTSRPRSRCLRRPSRLLLGPWTPSSSTSTTKPFSYLQIHNAIGFGDAEPPGHQANLPVPRRAVSGGLWTTVAACPLVLICMTLGTWVVWGNEGGCGYARTGSRRRREGLGAAAGADTWGWWWSGTVERVRVWDRRLVNQSGHKCGFSGLNMVLVCRSIGKVEGGQVVWLDHKASLDQGFPWLFRSLEFQIYKLYIYHYTNIILKYLFPHMLLNYFWNLVLEEK